MNLPAPATYEGQLAQRAAELMPHVDLDERLELLAVMEPDDMRTSLAFVAAMFPQVFDSALARDRGLVDRLYDRLETTLNEDGLEPSCATCGAAIGIFYNHGDDWHHYRGEGTVQKPVELFDAGHEVVVSWAPIPPAGEQ